MYITDEDAGEQLQAFRDRIFDRMRRRGQTEHVEFGEAFKLINDV